VSDCSELAGDCAGSRHLGMARETSTDAGRRAGAGAGTRQRLTVRLESPCGRTSCAGRSRDIPGWRTALVRTAAGSGWVRAGGGYPVAAPAGRGEGRHGPDRLVKLRQTSDEARGERGRDRDDAARPVRPSRREPARARGLGSSPRSGYGNLAELITDSAQAIRAAARSGWSPNSRATSATHPRTPSRLRVRKTASRTSADVGSWDGCNQDANSAGARVRRQPTAVAVS
jgi:hypothetical protein